jgi:uncharacterized protein (DUF2267 family)
MHAIQLEGIETTVQKTHEWVKEVMAAIGADDAGVAYRTLRAVLHALRDRLSIDEVVQLGAQLPMLIRGLYYEGWCPRRTSTANRAEFLERVRVSDCWRPGQLHPELLVRAVLSVLARHVSPGEVNDIQAILPADLRELWPVPAATRATAHR